MYRPRKGRGLGFLGDKIVSRKYIAIEAPSTIKSTFFGFIISVEFA